MTAPNIPNGLQLHAAGAIELLTPSLNNAVNVSSFIRTATGIVEITFATEIDTGQRVIMISALDLGGVAIFVQEDASLPSSPTTIRVRCYNAAGALSNTTGFSFAIIRTGVPA